MLRSFLVLLIVAGLFSCQPAQWQVDSTINLDEVSPIGIAPAADGNLWISDGDNNRMVLLNTETGSTTEFLEIERPMHIHSEGADVYVPSYGTDEIIKFNSSGKKALEISEELDAPAAYHRDGNKEAIADFYSHSVLMNTGSGWNRIGEQGQVDGNFRYPTDLHWFKDKLYVADAYNHRVQVFDSSGKHLLTFGEDEDMSATTGIFVFNEEVVVTDFENSRLMFYSLEGEFQYSIENSFDKPTDITWSNDKLYVTNYRAGNLTVLAK